MAETTFAGLSEEDMAREDEFLADVPFLNLGALFMPPIWGIAHGDWPCILFYPLWVFADNLIFNAVQNPSALTILFAIITIVIALGLMFAYARISSPRSAHQAAERGDTLEHYLKVQRRWAVGMAVIAIAMLIFATWYNLNIRPGL